MWTFRIGRVRPETTVFDNVGTEAASNLRVAHKFGGDRASNTWRQRSGRRAHAGIGEAARAGRPLVGVRVYRSRPVVSQERLPLWLDHATFDLLSGACHYPYPPLCSSVFIRSICYSLSYTMRSRLRASESTGSCAFEPVGGRAARRRNDKGQPGGPVVTGCLRLFRITGVTGESPSLRRYLASATWSIRELASLPSVRGLTGHHLVPYSLNGHQTVSHMGTAF